MRFALVAMLCASLAGCALPLPKTRQLEPREVPHLRTHEVSDNSGRRDGQSVDSPNFLSCTTNHDYLVADSSQPIIAEAWPFALMASNSYRTNAYFEIPGWTLKHHFRGAFNSGYGIAYQADVYVRGNEIPNEVAIVFRGTDHSVDWLTNLSLWWPWSDDRAPAQFIQAEATVRKIEDLYRGLRINLVGHSLGGGLAFHVGWTRSNARVFAFNTSPRVWASGEPIQKDRFDIAETGEVLRAVQFWRTLPGTKVRMNFRSAGLVGDHNMYYFARAILYQARKQQNEEAKNAFRLNVGCSAP